MDPEWGPPGQTDMLSSWLTILAVVALTALGLFLNVVVLKKAGRSPFWAILFLFPLLYALGMWVFAFARWPAEARAAPLEPEGAAGEGGLHGRDRPGHPYIGPVPNARRDFSDRRRW